MEIEELSDIDFDDLVTNIESDEEFIDLYTLYSSPYLVTKNHQYLFKLSIENDMVLLDEIKLNYNDDTIENDLRQLDEKDIIQKKNICTIDSDLAFKLINEKLDIRDTTTKLNYNGNPLCFEITNKNNLESILQKNKLIVLSELYHEISID